METNEQGLTREEKIMFFILGIILIVAVGVLIIDGFSKNDKSLNSETPTSEVETGKEESNTEDTESLKEAEEVESETKETNNEESEKGSSENTENKNEETVVEEPKENNESKNEEQSEVKENEQESSTDNNDKKNLPYTAADDDEYVDRHNSGWNFNREIVTEAYTGTKIHINKNVVLENGVMEEAVVTVRRVIGNRLVIIDTKNGEFIAEEGTYVYSYTHNNLTKEIKLNVYNKLEAESVSILGLKETDNEKKNVDANIYLNNHHATLTEDEDVYLITAVNNRRSNEVLIKVKLNKNSDSITSKTRGVKVLEPSNYHEELDNNEIILLINLDLLSKEDTNVITLNIDGTNYVFKLKVKMVNSSVEEENKKGESKEDTNLNKPIVEEPPEESDEALTEETLYEDYSSSVNLTLDVESQSLEEVP